jgi:hypothetical protein
VRSITVAVTVTEAEALALQRFLAMSKMIESFGTPSDTMAQRVMDALIEEGKRVAREKEGVT